MILADRVDKKAFVSVCFFTKLHPSSSVSTGRALVTLGITVWTPMQVCNMDKGAQTPLKTNKQIFCKKKTLLSKHLNDLSRQGRQKGVRICLLFHKASSIFIGFHAGVNIESKTFFCLTDRHTSQLTVLPGTSTFVQLHRCTTLRRKDEI